MLPIAPWHFATFVQSSTYSHAEAQVICVDLLLLLVPFLLRSAVALLSVNKLPAVGMLAPRLPDSTLYVVRNKRRRLAITPVDVDPDAEARQQQQQAQAAALLASSGASADRRPAAATRVRPNPHSLNF